MRHTDTYHYIYPQTCLLGLAFSPPDLQARIPSSQAKDVAWGCRENSRGDQHRKSACHFRRSWYKRQGAFTPWRAHREIEDLTPRILETSQGHHNQRPSLPRSDAEPVIRIQCPSSFSFACDDVFLVEPESFETITLCYTRLKENTAEYMIHTRDRGIVIEEEKREMRENLVRIR